MIGSTSDSASRKRSRDSASVEVPDGDTKNRKTSAAGFLEKRKKEHPNNGNDGRDREIRNGEQRINKSRVHAALWEKGREKDDLNKTNTKKKMTAVDPEKKKTITSNDYNKAMGTTFLEESKKKLSNASTGNNMQRHEEGRIMHNSNTKLKMKVSTTLVSEKEKKGKLRKTHREKMPAADSKENERKKKERPNNTSSDKEKKRKWPNITDGEETTPITSAVREKKIRSSKRMEIKIRDEKQNKRNGPLDVSNGRTDTSGGSNYKKRKRKSRGKEKINQASFAFLKFICNNFEKFVVIPPTVVPKLEYWTNHYVYLEDSEGKRSKVMVSKVDDSLAFHEGWDTFVSNHSIEWGEFLLFECIAEGRFSVRVFGRDSRERLYFNAGSTNQGDKKKHKWSNLSPDGLVYIDDSSENIDDDHYVSGEYPRTKVPETSHVTCNTKKDPKRVEHVVGSGPVEPDNNGKLIDPQCKAKGTSPLCGKEKIVIEILDSEPSAENEASYTTKLTTSSTDSDTRLVSVNTNEGPKRAQSGIGSGPSVILADEQGSFPDVECGTKCISPTCSEGKTRSQVIMTATALLDLHDSDEDLGRKQRTNDIPLDSVTTVKKYHNHSKMNIIQNLCRNYEAPGGFRCLEKWWKGVVNNQRTLDCTVLITPKNPQRTDSILVDGYGSTELNPENECFYSEGNHEFVQPLFTVPIKELSSADRVTNCRHDGTEIDNSINEKGGGASALLETKGEQLEPMGSIANSRSNNIPLCANPVVPGPIEKSSSPDGVSKGQSSMIEIKHDVNGKGTTVKIETKMDQVEPVRSSVCSKSCNILVCTNESECRSSSKQEGGKSSNCEVPDSSLPMEDEILELDFHSPPEINLQLCIPDTTQKWLDLPKSLSGAVRKRSHNRNVIMLKDPMERWWPILYHENPIFVGFTAGWKHFVAANNLQAGDVCKLIKEPDYDEAVYSVQMCCKIQKSASSVHLS